MRSTTAISRETTLLATVSLADLASTLWLLRCGLATEANPILAYYLELGIVPFALAKLLLSLGMLALVEAARPLCRPRFFRACLRTCLVAYVGIYSVLVLGQLVSRPAFRSGAPAVVSLLTAEAAPRPAANRPSW